MTTRTTTPDAERDPVEAALGRHLLALDGYRAIAAIMVVVTHTAFVTGTYTQGAWGAVLSRLDFGVTLFFLLSGFLLYSPWARASMTGGRGPRLAGYGWRRLLRIVPAYAVVVVVVVLALPQAQATRTPASIPIHLAFGQIYVPGALVEGLTQTWSLATEVSFYVLLPVIAWVMGCRGRGHAVTSARWQLWVLLSLGVVSLAWNVARSVPPLQSVTGAGFWLPAHLDWFALGMAGAVFRELHALGHDALGVAALRRVASDTFACLICAAALLALAATPLGGPYTLAPGSTLTVIARHLLYGAAAAALLLPAFLAPSRGSAWLRALGRPIPVYLGTISYGIFLWHLSIMWFWLNVLHWQPFGGGFLVLVTLTLALSVVVASASWHLLERPLLRLRGAVRP